MRKFLTVFFILFAASVSLMADGNRKSPYAPSAFSDNWFLQLGGGVNMIFNNGFGPVSPAGEFYVGKWFTPSVGMRIGALGFKNKPNGTQTGWFSGNKEFWFGHVDLDVMWNILNTTGEYNPARVYSLVPYIRGGAIYTNQEGDPGHWEPGGGLGIHNSFRVGKRVHLYVEASVVAAREKAYRERGSVAIFPTATAGVRVDVGKVGFKKNVHKEVVTNDVYYYVKDTVKVEEKVVETVVDSVLIKEMMEHPLTLYFDLDQTVLTQRELDHLERYATFVLRPDTKVHLTGSADKETGNPSHNQWLSEERNAYVRNILVKVYGMKPENISETANGDRKNEFDTKEKNRCVTIEIIDYKPSNSE